MRRILSGLIMAHLIYSALPFPRRPITFIDPETSVSTCIETMTMQDIGALVVLDGNALLGIVSERDIVRACLQPQFDLTTTPARAIAYANVRVLNVNDPIEKAMETITQTKRRHLLVSEHDELIAILSIGDLLFHILEDKSRVIEQLENYIHS